MGVLLTRVGDDSREVHLHAPNERLPGNKIDTAKYNLLTFLPKSVLLQFTRLSNVVFLANAVLQSIPVISTISPGTAIGPLAFVLALSVLREGYEDYKRHKKDWEINSRKTQVLRDGQFEPAEWEQLRPGDILKVCAGETVPADTLLLAASSETGLCYVETANLDGQTNLKEKQALLEGHLSAEQLQALRGRVTAEKPNSRLHEFEGRLSTEERVVAAEAVNLLLRETVVRNTQEAVGVAVYCGHDAKILQSQGRIHHKISGMERQLNYIQVALVVLLVLLCAASSLGYSLVHAQNALRSPASYVPRTGFPPSIQALLMFFTIFLLLNFLIPVTLNILIEGIKTFSALFLSLDRGLRDRRLKRSCGVLNSSIVEQLGLVDCVLTDKTGTLTANEMVFRGLAVGGQVLRREQIEQHLPQHLQNPCFRELLQGMMLCHDVVRDARRQEYQGSSPDEVCFVQWAASVGFRFWERTRGRVRVEVEGQRQKLELIELIPFSSRKRMSVIVREPASGKITLLTKGADAAIFSHAHWHPHSEALNNHILSFAKEGLRTLVFARRALPNRELKYYLREKERIRREARERMLSREEAEESEQALVDMLESGLEVVGATGIEDRLQEGVPLALARLQQAGIRLMMVTGDKLETAENIGYLSRLIRPQDRLFSLSADLSDVPAFLADALANSQGPYSLMVEGSHIADMLLPSAPAEFWQLVASARSVIFCRSTPAEKAGIARAVGRLGLVTLAIGDGGNDVGMIEEAAVGVGVVGRQGNSAAAASDFSIAQFRMLERLLLHHGRWFYWRLAYFFVNFGLKNMAVTAAIFFYLFDSAYSGTLIFTQAFYLTYNCFIGISMLVNSALFDQDANDDIHPILAPFLPRLYSEAKTSRLFSYGRYLAWSVGSVAVAGGMYMMIRAALLEAGACDADGRPADLETAQIASGMALSLVILLLNYLDTQSHTSFFIWFVLLIASLLPMAAYFIAENYWPLLGKQWSYSHNFTPRFALTIFLILAAVFLAKTAYSCLVADFAPSTLDRFKAALSEDTADKEALIGQLSRELGVVEEDRERTWVSFANNMISEIAEEKPYRSVTLNLQHTQDCLKEPSF